MQEITYIGRIIDNKKQAPISGAKVLLKGDGISIYTYTDIEGIYRFRIIPGSRGMDATITVETKGYSPYSRSVYLSSQDQDLGDIKIGGSSSTSSDRPSSRSERNNRSSGFFPLVILIAITVMVFVAFSNRTQINQSPRNQNNPSGNLVR